MKIKSYRGCGKSYFKDYVCFLKWKRLSYKHLKRLYKNTSFDDFLQFIDWLIDNKL